VAGGGLLVRVRRPVRRAGRADLDEPLGYSIADVLWLAMDIRNYDWLVRQRRWSPEQYQQWYVDTVAGALLHRHAGK